MGDTPDPPGSAHPNRAFASAEEWLAAHGIAREPLVPTASPSSDAAPPGDGPQRRDGAPSDDGTRRGDGAPSDVAARAAVGARPADGARAAVGAREALRLAQEAPPFAPTPAAPAGGAANEVRDGAAGPGGAAGEGREPADLQDAVSEAVAYARRATANVALSEQRLRTKLEQRGYATVVVDQALARCRRERLVDDGAYVVAFVAERRRKGHAPRRIRADLVQRGLPNALIDEALADGGREDLEARAFDVARQRAASLRGVAAEAAFRRLLGYLARRGYPEATARKVARQVIWIDREHERVAER